MRRRVVVLVVTLVIATLGCGGSGGATETGAGETGSASESGSADSGIPEPDACESSEVCEGGYCVAPWSGMPPRGSAQCVPDCVEALDLQRFCIDDAACCEGLSCSLDGLCEPPWDESTGDGDGDGDGDPTTGDGDGDPTTGDGDGDPTTGDGDGDPTTGDGDGDPTTGDGDGDGP